MGGAKSRVCDEVRTADDVLCVAFIDPKNDEQNVIRSPCAIKCEDDTDYPTDSWEIDPATITTQDEMIDGHFATVYKGLYMENKQVVIKKCKEQTDNEQIIDEEEFRKEIDAMKHLNHPNILTLLGVCSNLKWIITENMEHGCLLTFLKHPMRSNIKLENLLYYGLKIANGMAYVETKKMIHGDLAARNILIGNNFNCKISDFGMTRDLTFDAATVENYPIKWTAIEVITENQLNNSADVWSYGVVLWELLTKGEEPYSGYSNEDVINFLKTKSPSDILKSPPLCPVEVYDNMRRCWSVHRAARPKFRDLSTFFKSQKTEIYKLNQ